MRSLSSSRACSTPGVFLTAARGSSAGLFCGSPNRCFGSWCLTPMGTVQFLALAPSSYHHCPTGRNLCTVRTGSCFCARSVPHWRSQRWVRALRPHVAAEQAYLLAAQMNVLALGDWLHWERSRVQLRARAPRARLVHVEDRQLLLHARLRVRA